MSAHVYNQSLAWFHVVSPILQRTGLDSVKLSQPVSHCLFNPVTSDRLTRLESFFQRLRKRLTTARHTTQDNERPSRVKAWTEKERCYLFFIQRWMHRQRSFGSNKVSVLEIFSVQLCTELFHSSLPLSLHCLVNFHPNQTSPQLESIVRYLV